MFLNIFYPCRRQDIRPMRFAGMNLESDFSTDVLVYP